MSVWQTPHAWRRTSTSPAFGPASSTSWTTSGSAKRSSTAARIFTDPILSGPERERMPGVGAREPEEVPAVGLRRRAAVGAAAEHERDDARRALAAQRAALAEQQVDAV